MNSKRRTKQSSIYCAHVLYAARQNEQPSTDIELASKQMDVSGGTIPPWEHTARIIWLCRRREVLTNACYSLHTKPHSPGSDIIQYYRLAHSTISFPTYKYQLTHTHSMLRCCSQTVATMLVSNACPGRKRWTKRRDPREGLNILFFEVECCQDCWQ